MQPIMIPDWLRHFAMGALMLAHVQFAAFLIGIFGIAVAMEALGVLRPQRQHQFDSVARGIGKAAVIMYSSGAVLAIIFMLSTALFWPTFWFSVMKINYWPMLLEAGTFVLEAAFLFTWYYTWDPLSKFRGAHLALGIGILLAVEYQQSWIDVMASYMITTTPQGDVLRSFLNPTAVPLDIHRIIGDISFAGFGIAGYAAVRTLRAKTPDRQAYWDWVGSAGLIAGLGLMFFQGSIGIEYVEEIRANSPGAFATMMQGRLSWFFLMQASFLSLLFFLSVFYMVRQVRKSGNHGGRLLRGLLILVGLSGLLLIQPRVIGPDQPHAWLNFQNPIGTMQPWKYLAFAGLTLGSIGGLFTYLSVHRHGLRWGHMGSGGRGAQYMLLSLAVLASAMMLVMGYIRENARGPYLMYYQQQFQTPPEVYPTVTPTPTSQLPENPKGATDVGLVAATRAMGHLSENRSSPLPSRNALPRNVNAECHILII